MENELALAARLGLSQKTLAALSNCVVPEDALREIEGCFYGPWYQVEQLLAGLDTLQILMVYLHMIPYTRQRYLDRELPEEVLWDGLQDVGIWVREHEHQFDRPGLCAWPWVAKTLRMEVFRLGRLQFEPGILHHEIRVGEAVYPQGTPILRVHIPAEAPLDIPRVEASLLAASQFFREQKPVLLHCHSWLLSPGLRLLLPADSRILAFQALFHIYAVTDGRQAEERVFGQLRDDPAQYPEDTSLQRNLKAYLLSGKRPGVGMGVRLL